MLTADQIVAVIKLDRDLKKGGGVGLRESAISHDITCSRCKGCGHISAMDSNGPDAHEMDIDCPRCGGTGAI